MSDCAPSRDISPNNEENRFATPDRGPFSLEIAIPDPVFREERQGGRALLGAVEGREMDRDGDTVVHPAGGKVQEGLQNTKRLAEASSKLIASLVQKVECSICFEVMLKPAVLACGHTLCAACLHHYWGKILDSYIKTHPSYETCPGNVAQWRASLDGETRPRRYTSRVKRRTLHGLIHDWLDYHSGPRYTCPTCRCCIRQPPVFSYVLRDLAQDLVSSGEDVGSPWSSDYWEVYFMRAAKPRSRH